MFTRFTLSSLFSASTFALLALGSTACSSDTSSASDGTSSESTNASCDDICDSVTELCGSAPPNCTASCETFSATTRRCLAEATECSDIDSCDDESSNDSSGTDSKKDAGSSTSPSDGCDCKSGQFCILSSSVSSEKGTCVEVPDTCNGSKNVCGCLFTNSPCENGTSSCSEGVTDTISCN